MLKLGKVGKDDVVYDLGCGDGRIVVTAVKKFGAKKGVGIDLDPERIKESNANAKEAVVTDKVEFRLGDVMKIKDLENATVVTLYLGDELNEQLRPILQKRLKPGTRIVSHRFLMGDWKPEKTETVMDRGSTIRVHLWTIKKADGAEKKEKEEKGKKGD
jgi:cyclopropane fatty-acyl-phospholipid synthase-like methyltransferase